MTKQELIAILAEDMTDPEQSHAASERALLEFVNDPEITAAWKAACDIQGWWYA